MSLGMYVLLVPLQEDAIVQPLADVYYECLMEHLEVFHSRSFIMVAKSIQDVKDVCVMYLCVYVYSK